MQDQSQKTNTPPAPGQRGNQPTRPQGAPQGMAQQGARPQAPQGMRPQGARPQAPQGMRPQGARPQAPQGMRPQGARPQAPQGMRPQGARPQASQGMRPQGAPQGMAQQGARPQVAQTRPQTSQPAHPTNSISQLENNNELPPFLTNPKGLAVVCVFVLIVGLMLGGMLFGGSSAPVQQGLGGVTRNPDITQSYPRCGVVAKGYACILYIMNTTRYDRLAESFFDDAKKLTEAPRQNIAWANSKYAKTVIKPGHFVQILIPNLR